MLSEKHREQLELLRDEAARRRCVIKVHLPVTGVYFTLRDTGNDALIGRYPTLLALEDALINWVEPLPADDRDAELATRP